MKKNKDLRLILLGMALPLIAIGIILILVKSIPKQEEGWYVGQRADGVHMVQMDNGKNAEAKLSGETKKIPFHTKVIMEKDSKGNLVILVGEIQ